MPRQVVAREALPGEEGTNGTDYYAIRMPGISIGDVIEFHFDEVGTQPPVNSTALVLGLLNFTCPIGRDGFQFFGTWMNASVLYVTITAGNWSQAGVTDPALTRVGILGFKLEAVGNLW
jgi:hypothetical protein